MRSVRLRTRSANPLSGRCQCRAGAPSITKSRQTAALAGGIGDDMGAGVAHNTQNGNIQMPELISTTIVPLLASTAIKALITGQAPDPNDWASAATEILKALVDQQPRTTDTLDRMEKKLDQVSQQPFRTAFGAGGTYLEAAAGADDHTEWRSNLDKARDQFILALHATNTQQDPELARVIVEWNLAMVYLLMGNPAQCRQELLKARDEAGRAVLARVANWEGSTGEDECLARKSRPAPLVRFGNVSEKHLAVARRDFIDACARTRDVFAQLHATVEDFRVQLGEPAGACQPLRISTPGGSFNYREGPKVFMDLEDGQNDVFHIGIQIHRAVVGETNDVPFIRGYLVQEYVDVDLELTFPSNAEYTECTPLLDYLRPEPSVPPRPNPAFPKRSEFPPILTGEPGKPVRGWLRFASEWGRWPRVITFKLFPFGADNGHVLAHAALSRIAEVPPGVG